MEMIIYAQVSGSTLVLRLHMREAPQQRQVVHNLETTAEKERPVEEALNAPTGTRKGIAKHCKVQLSL